VPRTTNVKLSETWTRGLFTRDTGATLIEKLHSLSVVRTLEILDRCVYEAVSEQPRGRTPGTA
jgi:hypothetical protein